MPHHFFLQNRARAVQAIALALALSASCAATAAADPGAATPSRADTTRAEVIADLALWRRTGADRHDVLAHSYGIATPAGLAAHEEYRRLRHGEAFRIEVQKALEAMKN